jgi:hypothetical protein
MAASLAGWLTCALFASVAYNWTFYYLLALAAGPYRILIDRVSPARKPVPRLAQPRLEAAQA